MVYSPGAEDAACCVTGVWAKDSISGSVTPKSLQVEAKAGGGGGAGMHWKGGSPPPPLPPGRPAYAQPLSP